MRLKLYYLFIVLVGLGIATGCSDDDNDNDGPRIPVPIAGMSQAVLNQFNAQYPNAAGTRWSKDSIGVNDMYYVAEFIQANYENDAWYTPSGTWAMTETDYEKNMFMIPAIVNTEFEKTEYAMGWTIDDIDFYDYPDNGRDVYIIEVEKAGQPDTDVYIHQVSTTEAKVVKVANHQNLNVRPTTVLFTPAK